MEFDGKLAVITGGASGIGRSVALAMAKLGTDIVIADIDDIRMKEVCEEIESTGRHALAIHCDVTKDIDVTEMAARTISTIGVPDILINNAGIGMYGNFEKMSTSDYASVFDINVFGVIRGVLAFLPHMLKRGSGYIVNTASRAGFVSDARPYSLSKQTLIGYSEGLYCDLRPKGLVVSVLCPAIVKTNLFANSPIVGDEQEIKETQLKHQSFLGPDSLNPDDVAQMVIEAMKEKRFLILTPHTEDILAEAMKRGRDFHKLERYLQANYKDETTGKS